MIFVSRDSFPYEDVMGNFYETLGVPKNASADDIKKAYRKLAMSEHPDKGGNAERFKEISEAYDVLSDPEKKRQYDMEDVFGGNTSGFGFPFGAFSFDNFFGGPSRGQRERRVTEPIMEHVMITLEEAFHGCKKNIKVRTHRFCESCTETCKPCRGTGQQEVTRRMGPLIQTMIGPCDACRGTGSATKKSSSCNACQGKGSKDIFEEILLDLPAGVQTDDQYGFPNRGNHDVGKTPGDIIIKVHVKPNPESKLTVVGDNLVLSVEISLADSICGTTFPVLHPEETMMIDTRTLESSVIDPKKRYIMPGKGMPKKGKGTSRRGDLVITFQVRFSHVPTNRFSEQDKTLLRRILSE